MNGKKWLPAELQIVSVELDMRKTDPVGHVQQKLRAAGYLRNRDAVRRKLHAMGLVQEIPRHSKNDGRSKSEIRSAIEAEHLAVNRALCRKTISLEDV